ncbi:DNA alkylation repair protein [Mesorhizobium sp. SB112]|uniref:DNA alkylation repair protein n=1 Tax=Mesorhizobium sp. SB112 TaxID=3151853 RepID=UPI003263E7A1
MASGSLSFQSTSAEIAIHLKSMGSKMALADMKRVGIRTDTAIGVSNWDLRRVAKQVGRDHSRALELWKSGVRDARVLAIYTAVPRQLTVEQARRWAEGFDSWEIVDAAADLFVEAGLDQLISELAADGREFVGRTAFAMIAGMSVHRKKEPDATLLGWLPLIERHSSDGRNYIMKAVNWALRNIGKRNLICHGPALALAEKLAASGEKTTRWIGKNAVRELTSEKTLDRMRRRGSNAGGARKAEK